MNTAQFSQLMVAIMALPSLQRHQQLADVHTNAYTAYLTILQAIADEKAAKPVNAGEDRRTLAQVIGHIFAWDRFAIQGAGDLLAGIEQPRMIARVEKFIERDGSLIHFHSVDEFNDYHAQQQAGWDWATLRLDAVEAATVLHTLFTQPGLVTYERLDRTKPRRKRLIDGTTIDHSTMGWNLWITMLQHYIVEHAIELSLEGTA